MLRIQKDFQERIKANLKKRLGYKNDLQIPRLVKIVLSRGISSNELKQSNAVEQALEDFVKLSGQKPVVRKAKVSIAAFKLREGTPNGIMVTLRRERMYAFLDRFISVASPRIRDFRGLKVKGDKRGNFTIGIRDQRIFPETETSDDSGLQFTIITSAQSDKEARALLEEFGFPFVKN